MSFSYLDRDHGLCRPVVEVPVVQREVVRDPGFARAVHEVVLKQAESNGLHVVDAGKDLHTVNWKKEGEWD